MSKRLILVLALAFVVGVVGAAHAEVQNIKVSGDLTVLGVGRNNLILRKDANPPKWDTTSGEFNQFDRRISAILSQVRVRIDADLTDNVSATVRLLNERTWGEEASSDSGDSASSTDIDLDLAYVTLKDMLSAITQVDIPLTLTIGRQELAFGNQFIIGDVDTNGISAGHTLTRVGAGAILPKSLDDLSARKAFDAVRATLDYDPLVIDGVFALLDEGAVDIKDDVLLYGGNANYAVDKDTTVELYYWEKRRQKVGATTATGQQTLSDITRTVGTRIGYNAIKNLALSLEGAHQFGKHLRNTTLYPDEAVNDNAARQRKAYALQFISRYNLTEIDAIAKYEPVLGFSYTFLSGDKFGSLSPHYRGWDAMYENQGGGALFNKILGYSNAHFYNASLSVQPMEDVSLGVEYYYISLVKPYRITETANPYAVTLSGVLNDPTYMMVPDEKEIGSEIDATLTYDYTEDVQFALSGGWFLPGDAFDTENEMSAKQLIGSMKVTF